MRTEPGRGRVAQAIRAVPPSKDGVLQNGGARGDPEESLERTASRGWRTGHPPREAHGQTKETTAGRGMRALGRGCWSGKGFGLRLESTILITSCCSLGDSMVHAEFLFYREVSVWPATFAPPSPVIGIVTPSISDKETGAQRWETGLVSAWLVLGCSAISSTCASRGRVRKKTEDLPPLGTYFSVWEREIGKMQWWWMLFTH